MQWISRMLLAAVGAADTIMMDGAVDIAAAADGEAESLRRFTITAYTGGAMRFAWSQDPVVLDLAGLEAESVNPVLQHHNMARIVGHTDAIANDGKVLSAEGVISGVGEAAQEVVATSDAGFPWQASIGARMVRVERVPKGQAVTINAQSFTGPLTVVRQSKLVEISWVPIGAAEKTKARMAAQFTAQITGGPDMDFNEWLEARGFDVTALTDAQMATLKAAYDAEKPGPVVPNPADLMAEYRASMALEAQRIADIQRLGAAHPELVAKAISETWDATKMELEVLRASRHVPNVGGMSHEVAGADVLEAAVAQSIGMAGADEHYGDQVMQAAHQRFHGRLSLQELMLEAARANGYQGRNFRGDIRGILKAAFSSADISGILSNVANKSMLASFLAVEQSWRQIADIGSVSDFKTHTRYRLIGDDQYELVRPGGEIAHGTLGEDSTSIKADTYAKMFGINRTDLINDDLGILQQVPRKLGRGAGTKLNELFWTIFLANSSFFTGGNKNYISGSTTNLTLDSLAKADETLRDQTDHEGNPLGISGQILLVPNALRIAALALINSMEVRDTTANTKAPISNPFAGQLNVVTSAYLGNATYTGASTKAWYLLANPLDLATIEVAFLNGQQAPTIESADADFNRLGIQMRGYHDFGVALQEHRAGVKSKGEA
jgi:hypothetical protein